MRYDQAQLINTYLRAYEITGDAFHADVARGILTDVDRVMLHPEGGFYSAEDAESAVEQRNDHNGRATKESVFLRQLASRSDTGGHVSAS